MTFKAVERRHVQAARDMMQDAAGPIPDDRRQFEGPATVVRALMSMDSERRPDDEIIQTAISVALANGWEDEGPTRFAGKLGTLAWRQWSTRETLEQATLRSIDPGKVDHGVVMGLPGAILHPNDRKDVERTLDAMVADPVRMSDDRAIVEGRLEDMTFTGRAAIAADLGRETPLRSGQRLIARYEETLKAAQQIDEERHPLERFERIMVEKAKEAIVEIAYGTEKKSRDQDGKEVRRSESRHIMEYQAMLSRSSLGFDDRDMMLYNRSLMQRSGMVPPGEAVEREMAEYSVAIDPFEDQKWRREAMVTARRQLQVEGVPPHLQPEAVRQPHNVALPMMAEYDQRSIPERLQRAADELGVTPTMMEIGGEMAPLARLLHLHAPHALTVAEKGRAQMPDGIVGAVHLHADTIEHMGRGDFDQARHDLRRARTVAAWLAPRCSTSTKELMGLMRTDGRSQMGALLDEAEQRIAPEPSPVDRSIKGARLTPAMNAAARLMQGPGMA